MKKVVVKLGVHDEKTKQKAMSTVSGLAGITSISIDMKEKKLTVTGDVDPVSLVSKLRKICHTEIVSVGPEKEEKKAEPKKEEPKKVEPKKEEPKKTDDKKKLEDQVAEIVKAHMVFNPYPTPQYFVRSVEEDPNGCVIC